MVAMTAESELWAEYVASGRTDVLRNVIFERYHGLARRAASCFYRKLPRWIPKDEVLSDAYCGLIRAIERFDPDRGYQFATFAAQRMYGNMLDGMSRYDLRTKFARDRNVCINELNELIPDASSNSRTSQVDDADELNWLADTGVIAFDSDRMTATLN